MRGNQAHLTREGLDQVSADTSDIYRCWPPEGLQVPLLVQPTDVKYVIPAKAEIEMAVRGLKFRRAGWQSFMCA